jgi:hypothetical protein
LVQSDNDLIETYLTGGVSASSPMEGTEVIVTRSNNNIRVYSDINKADGDWFLGTSNSFQLPNDGRYWTENVSSNCQNE